MTTTDPSATTIPTSTQGLSPLDFQRSGAARLLAAHPDTPPDALHAGAQCTCHDRLLPQIDQMEILECSLQRHFF